VSAMLRLFGVASIDGGDEHMLAVPSELVVYRDLGALVADSPVARPKIDAAEIRHHREVIDTVFLQRAVLPAPMGVVFRSREMLSRWMELHYVTLIEGLSFVEGRVGARVHVTLRNLGEVPPGQTVEAASDLDAIAAVSFRIFRRQAAGWASFRGARETTLTSGASFLVDRERWEQFAEAVAGEEQRTPELHYRLTGPWPPYDFVRMQFGG
jgi:Gas vesicle synthesis protein GvpL/GvpF